MMPESISLNQNVSIHNGRIQEEIHLDHEMVRNFHLVVLERQLV